MTLTPAEIDDVVRLVAESLEAEKIILFGSYAKGTATIRSDLDLMVIKQTDLPIGRRAEAIAPLVSRYVFPIEVHVYTPEEIAEYGREPLSFIDSVTKTGRTVFERGATRRLPAPQGAA